uniref:helix-turn-helix transcriptional regulator n=1 Tax=Eubacterium sp. TaxID=142586 RepID=UPI0040289FE3
MYQSEFFHLKQHSCSTGFQPEIISAYKILADNSYYHYCDEDEKSSYEDGTYAFIRCTYGQGKIFTDKGTFILGENTCLFIRFNEIIKYTSLTDLWGYRWVNFTAKNVQEEFETDKIYEIPLCEKENNAFTEMLNYGKNYPLNNNYINTLFTAYFYSVMIKNNLNEEDLQATQSKLIDEICAYVEQKIYSRVSIDEISAFFRISPRRLHQIFTKELNISPKQYILKKKMEEGYKILVQTTIPVNKIANMLAFSSPYHFTHEFKKTFGITPREIRKEND